MNGGWAMRRRLTVAFLSLLSFAIAGFAVAQVPPEVEALQFDDAEQMSWQAAANADDYNVYHGELSALTSGSGMKCHGDEIVGTSFQSPAVPTPGEGFAYLVTGEGVGGEGPAGQASDLSDRALLGACDDVVAHHVMSRLGYGWSEWGRDRIAAIGIDAYIDEQLDPTLIDETTNTDLNDRMAFIDPPLNHIHLIAQYIVRGTYARRQFEQQVATFFDNHFSTYYGSPFGFFLGQFPECIGDPPLPWCDPDYPDRAHLESALTQYRDINAYRDLAFNGTFREMAEQVSLSTSMIFYLNTDTNVVGTPNENFARELLELYTCGVDNCYDQQDIEEVARMFTGWNVCRKEAVNLDDPLAPCIVFYWQPVPGAEYVPNFRPEQHDCGQKVLFHGQPQETIIPDTCGSPSAGVNDIFLALDAIVAHPETPRYISKKLLERFVTENPSEAMIDTLVDAWNAGSNPLGPGDMGEVLDALVHMPEFKNPDFARTKIKTPVEHSVSAFRATRGNTDGVTVLVDYLVRFTHLPHLSLLPTGYPESGGDWLGTNNMLERQNLGLDFTRRDPTVDTAFSADIMDLLADNGVSTAPGNAAGIVDFFVDAMFGGASSPAERQAAIDYLETDDDGLLSPYDEARIRETVGFLLGYPHFQEQ